MYTTVYGLQECGEVGQQRKSEHNQTSSGRWTMNSKQGRWIMIRADEEKIAGSNTLGRGRRRLQDIAILGHRDIRTPGLRAFGSGMRYTAFQIAPKNPRAVDTISAARATSVPCCWWCSLSLSWLCPCSSSRTWTSFPFACPSNVPRACRATGELGVACASDGDVTGSDSLPFGGGLTCNGELGA